MKIHPYYLNTAPWWIINGNLPLIDTARVMWRIGKALGADVQQLEKHLHARGF